MKHKLRMIWRILRDRQVVVITEDHGRMYYDWDNIRFLFRKVEEGKFNAYSDTEYLTKETCGEYLKSTKEHYFSKHV